MLVHVLRLNSGYRSDAEQARLFAANPDPKWVAPPGHSLHRYATELDLGPPAAYTWLAANAGRFGFIKRYSWVWVVMARLSAARDRCVGAAGEGRCEVPLAGLSLCVARRRRRVGHPAPPSRPGPGRRAHRPPRRGAMGRGAGWPGGGAV
jgi:hypothetical protein